jgi:hypothetical protein
MNKIILDKEKYTFDASAQTITFTEVIPLQHILLVTNITDNTIIYNFACDGFGGTISSLVLTLEYDTTSMSDSDELSIIVYTEELATDTEQTKLLEAISLQTQCLNEILNEIKMSNVFIKALA